jgi:hypothetical protein
MIAIDDDVYPTQTIGQTSAQAQNTEQPIALTDETKKRGGAKKAFTFMLILVAFLLVTGGGVYAYFYFFPTPDQVLDRMLKKSGFIKTFEYDGEADIKTHINSISPMPQQAGDLSIPEVPIKNDGKFHVSFVGGHDLTDLKKPRGKIALTLTTDFLQEEETTLGIEQINLDPKVAYIRLTEAMNVPFFDLDSIKNQWIKVDLEPYTDKISLEKDKKPEKTPTKPISEEKIKKVSDLAKKHRFIILTGNLPDEKIGGINSYHFKFSLDKEEFKIFIIESGQILSEKKYSEKELKDIKKNLDEEMKTLTKIGGDIWIGKTDYYPYKLTFNMVISDKTSSTEFSLLMNYKKFNIPLVVETPQNAITIEEATQRVFAAMYKDENKNGIPDAYEGANTDYSESVYPDGEKQKFEIPSSL